MSRPLSNVRWIHDSEPTFLSEVRRNDGRSVALCNEFAIPGEPKPECFHPRNQGNPLLVCDRNLLNRWRVRTPITPPNTPPAVTRQASRRAGGTRTELEGHGRPTTAENSASPLFIRRL